MRLMLVLCLGLLLPASLAAGPWPREKGTGFTSFAVELWQSEIPDLPHYYASSFVEYGLTERLTLGSKYAMGSQSGTLFDLRLGISLVRDRPFALSLELVAGERNSDRFLLAQDLSLPPETSATFASVGIAYGRGLALRGWNGWLSTELHVTGPLGSEEPALGLGGLSANWDSTLGVTLDNGWKLMAQVFVARSDAGTGSVKLSTSVAVPLGARTHVEIGARLPTDAPETSALLLGLWREF